MIYVSLLPKNIVCGTADGGKHRQKQISGSVGHETFAGIQKYPKNENSRSKLGFIKLFIEI